MMDVGIWLILHAIAELYKKLVDVINGLLKVSWDMTMQAGTATGGFQTIVQNSQQGFADLGFAIASLLLIIECYSEIVQFREARLEEVGRLALKIITANIIFANASNVGTGLFAFFSGGNANAMIGTIDGVAGEIYNAILETAKSFAPDPNTLAAVETLLGNTSIPINETSSPASANMRKAVAGFMGVNNMFAVTATMGVAVMSISMFINIVFHIVGIAIELAIYNIICPLPMACMISGHTRQIGMSFMKNYAGTAIQLGMISVTLFVCQEVSSSISGNIAGIGGGAFSSIMDMLAVLILPLEQIILIYLAGATIKRSGEMVKRALGT